MPKCLERSIYVYMEAFFSDSDKNSKIREANVILNKENAHLELFLCNRFIRKSTAYFVASVSLEIESLLPVISIFFVKSVILGKVIKKFSFSSNHLYK